jgi:collagenase-like PrtC family protease
MAKKIELLAPAGSMANLKAAVSRGADSVYLGMRKFNARGFATNFNEEFLKEAISLCHSNGVKVYLTMNTLIKNDEIKYFFKQLEFAYSAGIDAVIIQEYSFLNLIKKNFLGLRVHISTQAGIMNSSQAKLFLMADSITLARELTKDEISQIRNNFDNSIEIFCHGALCVSFSGSCLFSSLLGGRSGNRGKCAQPCRKLYNNCFYLSTKELCLIKKIPEIAKIGVDIIKIEGRMRTPYYVATVTESYRNAIDGLYAGKFEVSNDIMDKLESAFSRDFTEGWFSSSKDIFNRNKATGITQKYRKEEYKVDYRDLILSRKKVNLVLPEITQKFLDDKKIIARVYNKKDAIEAFKAGADIIYFDIFDKDFDDVKKSVSCKVFAVTPRIMLDSDVKNIIELIKTKKPDGLFVGNIGLLNHKLGLPIHLDYNCNCFNDIDVGYFSKLNAIPVISPELSLNELKDFKDKGFIAFVHGKIRLMTLRHKLDRDKICDETGANFFIDKIYSGTEIINEKELGLLGKSSQLVEAGINNLFIDTDKNVGEVVSFYKKILNKEKVDDSKLKKDYVLGWAYRGVY